MLSRSAADTDSTVCSPSLRQVRMMRTAISPRLAMKTLRMARARRGDADQRLTELHEGAVAREDLAHAAPQASAHGVHQLHHLDDADHGVGLDRRAHLDERRRTGLGRAVEGAEHRRGHVLARARRTRRWQGYRG
jgi:hypothetical protein